MILTLLNSSRQKLLIQPVICKTIYVCVAHITAHHNMRLHLMDAKCTFLNGITNEVYVKQPPGFESNTFQIMHYMNSSKHLVLDDIIFCAIDDSLCKEFSKLM
ncbi:hypothetical protein CR513_43295, partial [Mucuna pruriens]